jgi:DNA repair protein RecN (Recombination protein N)
MLHQLLIRNIALVDHMQIEYGQGLCVVSGETGSGKSLLMAALGLALGDRADPALIRHGQQEAEVGAVFDISRQPRVLRHLEELHLAEGDTCILRRVLRLDGRLRAWINGHPTTAQQLRTTGDLLVDLHGQHEHHLLLRPIQQRMLLDAFCDHERLTNLVAERYHRLHLIEQRLTQLEASSAEQEHKQLMLQQAIRDLTALDPQPGEAEDLEELCRTLRAKEQIIEALRTSLALTEDEEPNASALLARALHQLRHVLPLSRELAGPVAELEAVAEALGDALRSVRHLQRDLDLDPARLQALEERRLAFAELARRHDVPASQLHTVLADLRREQAATEDHDLELSRCKEELAEAEMTYNKAASDLSASRQEGAERLSQQVTMVAQRLGMPRAVIQFQVQRPMAERSQVTASGWDTVVILATMNPGEPPKPLTQVASGGELSRLSLAVHSCIAADDSATMVFDEVDVGIGGATAQMVGLLLARLAANRQVICITHLPQVAAFASWHLQVSKHTTAQATTLQAHVLQGEQRLHELARMLGGLEITAAVKQHAQELLAMGQQRELPTDPGPGMP